MMAKMQMKLMTTRERIDKLSRVAVAMGMASGLCGVFLLAGYSASATLAHFGTVESAADAKAMLRPAMVSGLYGSLGFGCMSLLMLLGLSLAERQSVRRIRRRLLVFLIPFFACCGFILFLLIRTALKGQP